jgi:hypothetical protein
VILEVIFVVMLVVEWVIEAFSAANLCQVKSPKVYCFSIWPYIDMVRVCIVRNPPAPAPEPHLTPQD